ncbi:MAG: alkaline phosphatase family protein [Pedococcus sp.]
MELGRRAVVVTALVALPALAGGASAAEAPAALAAAAPTPAAPCGVAAPPPRWDRIALLVFENRSYDQIVGDTKNAPYLNSLMKACGSSAGMTQVSDVSLPNYIALTSGYTGCDAADADGGCTHEKPITSNRNPKVWPQASASIFELLGTQAQELEEAVPSNCYLKGSGDFIINHAPFQFFTRARSLCEQLAVPFEAATASPNPLAKTFNLLTPARQGIMHGGYPSTKSSRTKAGDDWAKQVVPQLISSPEYQAGRTAIIITWDEGNSTSPRIPFIVISPSTPAGVESTVAYDHYSTLKGMQQMLGVTPLLGHAGDAGVSSIRDDPAFGLR